VCRQQVVPHGPLVASSASVGRRAARLRVMSAPNHDMTVYSCSDWRGRCQSAQPNRLGYDRGLARASNVRVQLEECESGRIGRSRKPLWSQGHRGFESHLLRSAVTQCFTWSEAGLKEIHCPLLRRRQIEGLTTCHVVPPSDVASNSM
jgi:hypothetical protein